MGDLSALEILGLVFLLLLAFGGLGGRSSSYSPLTGDPITPPHPPKKKETKTKKDTQEKDDEFHS